MKNQFFIFNSYSKVEVKLDQKLYSKNVYKNQIIINNQIDKRQTILILNFNHIFFQHFLQQNRLAFSLTQHPPKITFPSSDFLINSDPGFPQTIGITQLSFLQIGHYLFLFQS
ncbi:hypothetical protein PPERSA_02049 [Pseudocohnilembus persalinus]|uniref:Uncharacterized protein n=1 Tax=Pseudocohnilembus persalinus TaxID=266149 RepID=A0A0V0QF95_PSEPJ|nr:hypothetical protein PPERSA_02049 [Pseudocohnilembus persalinus]|eukprot:KRX00870.1 hypothetical protein PPERSA_02049 [Pseudocohnilembus persalinus]